MRNIHVESVYVTDRSEYERASGLLNLQRLIPTMLIYIHTQNYNKTTSFIYAIPFSHFKSLIRIILLLCLDRHLPILFHHHSPQSMKFWKSNNRHLYYLQSNKCLNYEGNRKSAYMEYEYWLINPKENMRNHTYRRWWL